MHDQSDHKNKVLLDMAQNLANVPYKTNSVRNKEHFGMP